jgi:hypothetical protein
VNKEVTGEVSFYLELFGDDVAHDGVPTLAHELKRRRKDAEWGE